MRRKDRLMPEEEAWELLRGGEYGVLSTVGADGAPYGVPLNYVVIGRKLYFHCARQGQKLDHLQQNPAASFCVVGQARPVYTTDFTTHYQSVIAFGTAARVTGEAERRQALMQLMQTLLPQHMEHAKAAMDRSFAVTDVWAIEVEHLTGKQNMGKRHGQ